MSKEFKKLNLDRNKIISNVNRFCEINFNNYCVSKTFKEMDKTRRRLNISIDGNRHFFIDFHFNTSDATTTIEYFGGNEVELKKQLAKFIKDECLVSDNSTNKWFIVNNINKDDFESILEIIEESHLYKETSRKQQLENSFIYQCKSKDDEKITINYYSNKKVVIQGRPLLLFNEIITMFSELIDFDEIPKVFNDCYEIEIKKDDVMSQYEIKMPNSYNKNELKLKKVLLQAVYNTNIKGDMFDYSYLVAPALRALEGHIKYVYKHNSIIIGDKQIGIIFDNNNIDNRHYLKNNYKTNLDNNKIKYIEKAYNYYFINRHSLFHWNDVELPQDDTRIIENYGEAIRIINDILDLIDSYYIL